MSLTRKKPAELDTSSTIKAVKRAQKARSDAAANTVKAAKRAQMASSAAAASAASAAQNAAVTAQNAAEVARAAAQNAAAVAANAAQTASSAAQSATADVNKSVRQGVYTARSWAAPRLESAADYTSSTVAPKVSAALRATARQVSPPDTRSPKKKVLAWTALGAAVLAALGAAGAVARYRYRAAIAEDSEKADEEVMADSAGSQAAPVSADEKEPEGGKSKDQAAEKSANGQVTATGW